MQVSVRVYAAASHWINRRFVSRGKLSSPGSLIRLLVVVSFVSCGCAPGGQSEPPDEMRVSEVEQIAALWANWITASNAGDLEAMKGFYAADAFIAPPGSIPVTGTAGIGKWIDSRPEEYPYALEMESLETVVTGDWAFDRGTYALHSLPRDPASPPAQSGSYLRIWRKERGTWKIARDIWNRMSEVELGPGIEFLPK